VDILLLDNMKFSQIRRAVKIVGGKCLLEISGGVTLKTVRQMASTGVARISIGALTHSAPAVDISLEIAD
jgi:nicotinate-nucleotide pyrophosphorylase (carboxylating)